MIECELEGLTRCLPSTLSLDWFIRIDLDFVDSFRHLVEALGVDGVRHHWLNVVL